MSGLAAAARALLPEAVVTAWHVGVDHASSAEAVAAALLGSDLVLSQFDASDTRLSLRPSALRARDLVVVEIPVVVFAGFHPDMIYVAQGNGRLLHCQGGDYHSRITAAGFRLGLDPEQIFRLFNGYVFSAFRYFDVFDAASTVLISAFEKHGYDLRPLIARWTQHTGAFMYTINHPKAVVLSDLCTLALRKAGLIADTTSLVSEPEDYLKSNFIGAVFHPVAKRLGIEASDTYQRAVEAVQPGQQRQMTLLEYIAGSYLEYQDLPPDFAWTVEVEAASDILRTMVVAPVSKPRRPTQVLLEAARAATGSLDWAEATLRWSELVTLEPDQVEQYIQLGASLRELCDWARCETFCTQAWERFPSDVWVGRNWALSAHYAGNIAEAIRRYTEVAERHHHDVIAADLADCLLISGDLDAAENVIKSALDTFTETRWLRATKQRLEAQRSRPV